MSLRWKNASLHDGRQRLGPTLVTLYIAFWVAVAGIAVDAGAHAGILLQAAVPFALALIAVLRIAGPTIEQIAWAVFTAWLGITYAHTGGAVEVLAFFVCLTLAAMGVFVTPWALGVAWLLHIAWDLVPRDLPAHYASLPPACALFDGTLAAYLLWCAKSGRWRVLTPGAEAQPGAV